MRKPRKRRNELKQPAVLSGNVLANVVGGAGWGTAGPHSPPQPGG